MPFVPDSLQLYEGGADTPHYWSMTVPLTWTGTFRGKVGRLLVPASETEPFRTDLASVPPPLTWLIPRYGRYTKAAVLHDYLCQVSGRETIAVYPTPAEAADDGAEPGEPHLLPVEDRSDADEIFRLAMTELGVPWPRRWLMWSAVTWATLATSLRTGRASKPAVLRWIGLAMVVATLVAGVVLVRAGVIGSFVDQSAGWRWLRAGILVVVGAAAIGGCLMAAGYLAQARWDRWLVYLAALAITVAALPLLVVGAVIAFLLLLYLLVEAACSGFSGVWARIRRRGALPSPAAVPTPHAERLDAVRTS